MQDSASILSDVREIIAEQLGKDVAEVWQGLPLGDLGSGTRADVHAAALCISGARAGAHAGLGALSWAACRKRADRGTGVFPGER